MLSDGDVSQVLVITAHPDDAEFGVAGAVATWTAEGIKVSYCIVTDGDAGGFDPDVERSKMADIRRAEQQAAASVVGVDDVEFLGYPDGRLIVSLELRRDLARVIRRVRPQRLVCPSPERVWQRIHASHPDHLATGEAAFAAVYPDARNPFAFPELLEEGYEAHTVAEVWLMANPHPDHFVDITTTFDRKIAALRCHHSQLTDPEAVDGFVREFSSNIAAAAGLPEGHLAEAFRVVSTA